MKRVLVAALAVATVGFAAWCWWPARPTPAADAHDAHEAVVSPPLAHVDRGASVERTDVGVAVEPDAQAPLPEGAVLVEVRVVGWVTHACVADADVWWFDPDAILRFYALPEAERAQYDFEAKARAFGRHARTDELGIVHVPAVRRLTDVCARHGERFGGKNLYAWDAAEGVELEISQGHKVDVRVVDTAGVPVAGVPLEMELEGHWRATTPAAGTARFEYCEESAGRGARRNAVVRVSVPGLTSCAVGFDWSSPPAEPLTLVLPPVGEMHVHVVYPGRAVESLDASMWIARPDDPEAKERAWRVEADAERVVRFRPVPLGATFEVEVAIGDLLMQRAVPGPSVAGQVAHATIDVPADTVSLVGRVLHPDGRPVVSDHDVWLRSNLPRSKDSYWIDTDARGYFLWHPDAPGGVQPRELTEFALRMLYGPFDAAYGRAAPRTLRPGVNDLGDIQLVRPPLLVGGRFQCTEEPPVVPIEVQRWIAGRPQQDEGRWENDGSVHLHQHDGRFVVTGEPPPGPLRVTFGSLAQPVEFVRGTADLVVPLIVERR